MNSKPDIISGSQGTPIAIVTGAASGLGFALAKLLAADGHPLLMIDKNEAGLAEASTYIQKNFGTEAEILCLNLSSPESPAEIMQLIGNRDIGVLINNAGFGLYGPFSATSWEPEAEMIHLHVLNLTRLTKLVLQNMLRRKAGKIMNVSSLAALQPGPLFSVYSASKAYIRSFSLALAAELRGSGITVTVLCPGQTHTNFAREVSRKSGSALSKVPMTANAEEVAVYGYKAMLGGKPLAIPGFTNKCVAALTALLPNFFTARINMKIQQKIRNQ